MEAFLRFQLRLFVAGGLGPARRVSSPLVGASRVTGMLDGSDRMFAAIRARRVADRA
jgi:hypothetical protein